jgi:predicted enzyme related to lactoylglutathione lyase
LRTIGVSVITLVAWLFLGAVPVAAACGNAAEKEEHKTDNPVVFWELASNDAGVSVEFFKKIFDWKIEKIPGTIIHGVDSRTEEVGIDGGIFTLQKAKLPFITVYILVDDIVEKAKLIKESGGLVIEKPHEISSGTWICLFNDPSGVTFAMYQKTSGGK